MGIILGILCILPISFIIYFYISITLYIKKGKCKVFCHDILQWHLPNQKYIKYTNDKKCSTCKYCTQKLVQDKQGNWTEV